MPSNQSFVAKATGNTIVSERVREDDKRDRQQVGRYSVGKDHSRGRPGSREAMENIITSEVPFSGPGDIKYYLQAELQKEKDRVVELTNETKKFKSLKEVIQH